MSNIFVDLRDIETRTHENAGLTKPLIKSDQPAIYVFKQRIYSNIQTLHSGGSFDSCQSGFEPG